MASTSSSSTVTTSSGDNPCTYDVFLSFCGEDTRNSFTDHLYHKLVEAGIHTFRDNEGINKGGELKREFKSAVEGSRASIVVLSSNYATSTWCLDELLLILKRRRELNHFVLPVFYGVEPTDVRNLKGKFAIEAKPSSSSSRWTEENVEQWKVALKQVADLAGHVLSGLETRLLKGIVETIYNELDLKEVYLPVNIIGMTTRYIEINSWFGKNSQFLAIYGMGGSGKKTFAKYIYASHKKSFAYVSFIEDIDRTCDEPNGLEKLQEQLLKDITGGKNRKIPGVSRGTCMIGKALELTRTLIVLDDISDPRKLQALLGTGNINAQSKIIITTRENTDTWFHMSHWRCQKYKMKLLNDDESTEFLCRHAFGSIKHMAGFKELVVQAVQFCEGNPLALEVLGSSLSQDNTIMYWESQLQLLQKDFDSRIQDMDYVVKILEPDYSAASGIKTLINRCLLSVLPNKKLMMHQLLQNMGKNIVRQESTKFLAKRSRVWLSSDSYKILSRKMGSETIEGLALDMEMLMEENFALQSTTLQTEALKNMDSLKLLQLNFAELSGSYENFSEDLRWLCWVGFPLRTIPSELCMGKLVAIDMSYGALVVFEPPAVLQSLQILNLKDSHHLLEIRNIFMIPQLETLILWNCYSLVHVCKTIERHRSLVTLNMTGCKNLFNRKQITRLAASTSGVVVTQKSPLTFPCTLHRLFLKDCHLTFPDPILRVQSHLQYLNLGHCQIKYFTFFDHLEHLRVLDLSFCSKLTCLLRLPSTLAELYVYYCESLERITFQSPRFTLQEIGYEGCISLNEVEGFIKLVPIAKLDESDLGHMKWLKEYENHLTCLVGDELTVGRSWRIQMLYEFGIMSTFLPDLKDPRVEPTYVSRSSFLSFEVPSCPKNKTLKGINVTFKYKSSKDDWGFFCKISTTNGVNFMYNPKVFGKPRDSEVCTWLSYWPIGNKLTTGDNVNVSFVGLRCRAYECGVSLVYSDEEMLEDMLEYKMGWEEVIGRDLSRFELSTGAYYLCHSDFFASTGIFMTYHPSFVRDWFRQLLGDTIDRTELRGWRKTGRPTHVIQSYTELKTIRCIIRGPQVDDIYEIEDSSAPSFGVETQPFSSSLRTSTPQPSNLPTEDEGTSKK